LTADHLVADFFSSKLGGTFDRGPFGRRFFFFKSGRYV
jgi:hypothetical protein